MISSMGADSMTLIKQVLDISRSEVSPMIRKDGNFYKAEYRSLKISGHLTSCLSNEIRAKKKMA